MTRSSFSTSPTRRSRRDLAAVSTAAVAARSHDSVLVPTTSVKRYTLSGIGHPLPLDDGRAERPARHARCQGVPARMFGVPLLLQHVGAWGVGQGPMGAA